MTISRRATLKTLGAIGAGTAMTGTALAVGEHDDDEREAEDDEITDEEEAPDAVSAVRVAHFSPDAPNVDVYVDDDQVLSDVAYDDVSPYLELEPGTYTVTITAADDPETVAFEDEVSFGRAFYTVAAIGELEGESFRPLILTDAGSALIRLAHASPDAPAVDVVGSEGQPTLFENVSFGQATNYVALPAGNYSLDVLPAEDTDVEDEAGGEAPDAEEEVLDEDEDADDFDEDNGDNPDDEAEDDDLFEEDEDDEEAIDDDTDDDEDVAEDDADAVTTLDIDLEQGTAYTAFATGYLEADEEDREFAVNLTVDGPMAGEDPVEDEHEADDDFEDDDLEDDDEYDDDDDLDDDDEYDDDDDLDDDDEYDDDDDYDADDEDDDYDN